MFRGQKVLAVVPARGGSKRLPDKNLRSIQGRPLVVKALDVATDSRFIDRGVLSTDDHRVVALAREYGYSDVLMRPDSLADDQAAMTSVLLHVVGALRDQGAEYGYLVLLQPTSPLREARHVDQGFVEILEKSATGLLSVCLSEKPKEWLGNIGVEGSLNEFIQETNLEAQSQDLKPTYQINGAIYIVPVEQFLEYGSLFLPDGMVALVMERSESIDIDYDHDFQLAEWLLQNQRTTKS